MKAAEVELNDVNNMSPTAGASSSRYDYADVETRAKHVDSTTTGETI